MSDFRKSLSPQKIRSFPASEAAEKQRKTDTKTSRIRLKNARQFSGRPVQKSNFRVPSKEERTARRLEFEQEKRAEFIKFLAKTQRPALLAAGITKKQIAGMENGFTPHGFNTHHKLPIYGGGTNDFPIWF